MVLIIYIPPTSIGGTQAMQCTQCIKKDQELKMIKELYREILTRFNELSLKWLNIKHSIK